MGGSGSGGRRLGLFKKDTGAGPLKPGKRGPDRKPRTGSKKAAVARQEMAKAKLEAYEEQVVTQIMEGGNPALKLSVIEGWRKEVDATEAGQKKINEAAALYVERLFRRVHLGALADAEMGRAKKAAREAARKGEEREPGK